LSNRVPAVAQIIHQTTGFGRLDPARSQEGKDLRVRMTRVEHGLGTFHIRRQNVVRHI
jgi:hypothetical protein